MKQNKLIWITMFFLIVLTLNVSGASNLTFSNQVLAGYHFTSNADVLGLNNISGSYGTLTTDKNGASNQAYNYGGAGSDNIPANGRFNLNASFGMMLWTTKNNANSGIINKGPLSSDYGQWSIGNDRFYFHGSDYNNVLGLDGSWNMVWMEYNKTSNTLCTSKNNGASTCSSVPAGNLLGANPIYIGVYYSTGFYGTGKIDEWVLYNGTITATQRTEYYNLYDNWSLGPSGGGGGGSTPSISFTTPPTPTNNSIYYLQNQSLTINATISSGNYNITLQVFNSTGATIYTNTSINNNSLQATLNTSSLNFPTGQYYFNATFLNATYSNFSETRIFTLYNITQNGINQPSQPINTTTLFVSWNASATNPNVSNSFTYNVSLQNITGSFLYTLNTTNTLNYTVPNLYIYNLSIDNYTINITSLDFRSNQVSQTKNIQLINNAQLNITIRNAITNTIINDTTNILITNTATGLITNKTFANGTANFDIAKEINYTIAINSPAYVPRSFNYTTTNLTFQAINLTLYTNNSVNIFIFDEGTGANIYANVTILLSSIFGDITYNTNTSNLYLDNLNDGNYSLTFSAPTYSTKVYEISVASRSTQTLNAFLSTNSTPVVFTILDSQTRAIIEGATFIQYRKINGTWTIVDTKTSDITGRVQVYYVTNIEYQFQASATNYQSNLFTLNPVLFTTYDVPMTRITSLTPSTTPDYTAVSITYYNTTFYNNRSNALTWTIVSPSGALERYNLSIIYPTGGNLFQSGTNAIGQTYTQNFTITGANLTSMVNIKYCYETTTSFPKCFQYNYNILNPNYGNYTFIANKNNKYGMGVLETTLIATITILIVAGLSNMVAGTLGGILMGLLMMGFFVSTGFITLWQALPSMLVGFIYIAMSNK